MKRIVLIFIVLCALIMASFVLWGGAEAGFEQQLTKLISNRQHYAVFSYFLLASDIVLPVPNSIMMYSNGYVLGVIPGTALSVFSMMTGALAGYYLGKCTAYGSRSKDHEKARIFWEKYGPPAILVTRGIPVVSESICIIGGYAGMPLGRFLLLNLLGYIPVALVFALFGAWGYDKNVFLVSLVVSLVPGGFFWWWDRKKARLKLQDSRYVP